MKKINFTPIHPNPDIEAGLIAMRENKTERPTIWLNHEEVEGFTDDNGVYLNADYQESGCPAVFLRSAYAVAPELLASLKNTLPMAEAYYRTLPDDGPEQDHYITSVIEPARAAIAKAEGK